jgi:hypothetical protein
MDQSKPYTLKRVEFDWWILPGQSKIHRFDWPVVRERRLDSSGEYWRIG